MRTCAPRADPRPIPPGLRRYVVGWVAAGTVVVAAATGVAATDGLPQPLWAMPVIVLLAALSSLARIVLPIGSRQLSMNLVEAAVVVALVLTEPLAIVLPIALGVLVVDVIKRVGLHPALYNAAVTATGAAAAAVVVALALPSPPDPATATGLGVLVLALLASGAVTQAAATALVVRLDATSYRIVARSMLANSALSLALAGALGVLVAILGQQAPVALPVLALAAWMVHRSIGERVARISDELAERDRLERTVEGASDGIALLDADGVVELANPAYREYLGVTEAELIGRPLLECLRERTGEPLADVAADLNALQSDERRATSDLLIDDRIFELQLAGTFDQGGRRTGTVVLLSDVTERRETERLRREFMARASHELRTPLTTIIGFVETLRERDHKLTAAERERYLNVVARQADRLHRLVGSLVWSSRLEGGVVAPDPAPVDVAQAVDEVLLSLKELDADQVEVAVPAAVAVRVDADHLQQMLGNLLSNAATYGRPPIRVAAFVTDAGVVIEVSDGGDGVPPSFERQLFRAFAQASVGDRRTAQGLGLGLAIVRTLVRANGGTIRYERRDGRTCLRLTLPAATADRSR